MKAIKGRGEKHFKRIAWTEQTPFHRRQWLNKLEKRSQKSQSILSRNQRRLWMTGCPRKVRREPIFCSSELQYVTRSRAHISYVLIAAALPGAAEDLSQIQLLLRTDDERRAHRSVGFTEIPQLTSFLVVDYAKRQYVQHDITPPGGQGQTHRQLCCSSCEVTFGIARPPLERRLEPSKGWKRGGALRTTLRRVCACLVKFRGR